MKKRTIFILFVALLFNACQDFDEINKNPNNVNETHPQLLLTQIQKTAFQVEGKSPLHATRILVSTDGENEYQYFKWDRSSFGYYDQLRQVTKMLEESKRIENDTYIAISKFFRAYYFYKLTLRFGDIPYSEALQGETEDIYAPKYDSQKDVFIGILSELKKANELLINNNDIIKGDIIYDGHAEKWQKLVNSFRLKVLLTLSKKVGDAGLNIKSEFSKISSTLPIISSNDDNAQLVFLDQVGSRYSEFNDSGYGSAIYMSSTFTDELKKHKDPRLFLFADRTKKAKEEGLAKEDFIAYDGGDPTIPYAEVNDKAAKGLVSKVDLRFTTNPANEPHNILGYWEVELILAEAAAREWINDDAKKHYENAIYANFDFYNTYAPEDNDFVSEEKAKEYLKRENVKFDSADSLEDKVKLIINQKYYASFLQGGWTVYFDHLRTGYPHLPTADNKQAPYRWMYPLSEYNNNKGNVSEAIKRQFGEGNDKVTVKTWWLK